LLGEYEYENELLSSFNSSSSPPPEKLELNGTCFTTVGDENKHDNPPITGFADVDAVAVAVDAGDEDLDPNSKS
jgi:hypothetical protein